MNVENGMRSCKCFCPSSVSCTLSGWPWIEYVIFLQFLWWVAYFFIILISKQSGEWSCRILTTCHGCVVFYSASKDIWNTLGGYGLATVPLSEDQKSYLSFMLSYFIFDFCWIHLYGNETWIVYFHHVSSILIIIQIIQSDFGGMGISYGAAGLEFTNPYLQLRWFLRSHGFLNTPIHTAVELWFFFCFLLIRLVGGTILFYKLGICAKTGILMKISLCSVYAISVALAWQIIEYFRKKYFNGGQNTILIMSRVNLSPFFPRKTLNNDRRSPDRFSSGNNSSQSPSTSDLPLPHITAANGLSEGKSFTDPRAKGKLDREKKMN